MDIVTYGRDINAEQVERIISRTFTGTRFAALCNALSWAAAGRQCPRLPAFTERTNVGDDGIDAEWSVDLIDTEIPTTIAGLVGPGWNIYQYKQRDITASGRPKALQGVKDEVRHALRDIHANTQRRPDHYTLFTNLHLTPKQKQSIIKYIVEEYDKTDDCNVTIVTAAELAVLLNNNPHLRSAFFGPAPFRTWHMERDAHAAVKTYGATVPLIGREWLRDEVQAAIDDKAVRVIILPGPSGIGKTRLALEATEPRATETLVSLDPRSLRVADLAALSPGRNELVLILDDPEPSQLRRLVDHAITEPGLTLIVTLPTAADTPLPAFNRDQRIRLVEVGPLSNPKADALLVATGITMDIGLRSWVIEQAGGNPDILLYAAHQGGALRPSSGSLVDDIGRNLEQNVRLQLGEGALEALRIFSLLHDVHVNGGSTPDLDVLIHLIGSSLTPNAVIRELPRLEGAGVVRRYGDYVRVTPLLLANRLAGASLVGRASELQNAVVAADPVLRRQLIGRLQSLDTVEVRAVWVALFSPGGPLQDFPSASASGDLLLLVAGAVPIQAYNVVHAWLVALGADERRTLAQAHISLILDVLDALLFRSQTSIPALQCLGDVAESAGRYKERADEVFCECLHPSHPQFPAPLDDRLVVLENLLDAAQPESRRLLAITAIEEAFKRIVSVSLRYSTGPGPLDVRPVISVAELRAYREGLVDLLMEQMQVADLRIAVAAAQALPAVLAEFTALSRAEAGVARFETVVDWILRRTTPVSGAAVAEALSRARRTLEARIGAVDDETDAHLQGYVDHLNELLSRLDQSDFAGRLERWTGSRWTHEGYQWVDDGAGGRIYRIEAEMRALAEEVIISPQVLTPDLLAWIRSEDAPQGFRFLWWLGAVDTSGSLLPVVQGLGAQDDGAQIFAAYIGGMGQRDTGAASDVLDRIVADGNVTARGIVDATMYLPADDASVERIEALLTDGRINVDKVVQALSHAYWFTGLDANTFLGLLKVITGSVMEYASVTIHFLAMWLQSGRALEGQLAEYAWQCLEALPPASLHDAYYYDHVAATLINGDLDRGFALLDALLRQSSYDWYRLDPAGQQELWRTLHNRDSKRALELVLDLAHAETTLRARLTWRLREVLADEGDSDVLGTWVNADATRAAIAAASTSSALPGFWHLAAQLITEFPRIQTLKQELTAGAEVVGEYFADSWDTFAPQAIEEIGLELEDLAFAPAARRWLEERQRSLRDEIARREMVAAEQERRGER